MALLVWLPATNRKNGTLTTAQGRGWKGHSAIDQAAQHIIKTEIVHFRQIMSINLYLNLNTCFDLMVEACHNLACRWHGADDAYLRLHAITHKSMRYHIRHKYGVSQEFNTFEQNLWHGTGQGAVDAALQYIVLSDTLINAYHTKIAPTQMQDPTTMITIQRSLKAFIDDIVLHASDGPAPDFRTLQLRAQAQLQWWDKLVQITGRALNAQKCYRLIYTWELVKRGILQIAQPDQMQQIIALNNGQTQVSHASRMAPDTWVYMSHLTATRASGRTSIKKSNPIH